MSKNLKPFVIRGFDPGTTTFNCNQDSMAAMASFNETVIPTQASTIITMLTKTAMAVKNYFPSFKPPLDLIGSATDALELSVIDIKVITSFGDAKQLRLYRTPLRSAIKGWAEKSTVQKARGFRLNAIKTPKMGVDQYSSGREVVIKTQAILGSTLFYNEKRMAINFATNPDLVREDMQNLKNGLVSILGPDFVALEYDHPVIGKERLV